MFLSINTRAATIESTFNIPGWSGAKTTTIENRVIELINQAVPGSSIHFSMYDFDRTPIALALLRANARGVKVNAVFDGALKGELKKQNSAMNILFNGSSSLGLSKLNCTNNQCLKFCKTMIFGNSCRGLQNNHNKFILLSGLNDGRKNVVAMSSANWTDGQLNLHNDMITVFDDVKLYNELLKYWEALRDQNGSFPLMIEGDSLAVFTFPNKGYDPVLELLNKTSCQLPNSKIRILQSRFTDHRSAVAARLVELAKQGCDVKVLVRDEPDMSSPGKRISSILGSLMNVLKFHTKGAPDRLGSVHSKIVLIDASIGNSTVRIPLVLAGSHNLNGTSLTQNDELLARIVNQSIFNQYMNFWNQTYSSALAQSMLVR